jgi:hypothetical protein
MLKLCDGRVEAMFWLATISLYPEISIQAPITIRVRKMYFFWISSQLLEKESIYRALFRCLCRG